MAALRKRRGLLQRMFREPSTLAGAAITAIAGPEVAGALLGAEAAPAVGSAEFTQALAVVIAGLLAMFLKEKGDGSDA